jgi:hypothetical protein
LRRGARRTPSRLGTAARCREACAIQSIPRSNQFRDRINSANASIRKTRMLKIASAALLVLSLTPARAADVNDYPTEARADYVYVCMKTNGETREALKRCSCSIDVIASLLPYQRYEEAETVASMDLSLGAVGMMFRNSPQAKAMSDDLRRAQAEAEIRCF